MYNLCDYLTYQCVFFFVFFSNNVGSYDPQSYLPPTILRRIPILTTLLLTIYFVPILLLRSINYLDEHGVNISFNRIGVNIPL